MKEKAFITVNIPVDDHAALKQIAGHERRSLGQQLSYLIDQEYRRMQPTLKAVANA